MQVLFCRSLTWTIPRRTNVVRIGRHSKNTVSMTDWRAHSEPECTRWRRVAFVDAAGLYGSSSHVISSFYIVWVDRCATLKSTFTNRRHTVWDINRGQRCAMRKSMCTNRCHAVWDIDGWQRCAHCKGIFTNVCDTIWYNNRGQRCAPPKSMLANIWYAVGDRNCYQRGAPPKSILANLWYAVWDGNRGQRGATPKCSFPDRRHTVWEIYGCQRGALPKNAFPDRRYTIWEIDGCQRCATHKSGVTNRRDTLWDVNAGQWGAVPESICTDCSDVVMRIDRGYIQFTNLISVEKLTQFFLNRLIIRFGCCISNTAIPNEWSRHCITPHRIFARFTQGYHDMIYIPPESALQMCVQCKVRPPLANRLRHILNCVCHHPPLQRWSSSYVGISLID